jgi:hypothetical protein
MSHDTPRQLIGRVYSLPLAIDLTITLGLGKDIMFSTIAAIFSLRETTISPRLGMLFKIVSPK